MESRYRTSNGGKVTITESLPQKSGLKKGKKEEVHYHFYLRGVVKRT